MREDVFALQAGLEDRHWWFVARRAILHAIVAAIEPPDTGAVILDVGCGTGGNAASFAAGYRVVGIEPAAPALALARRRYPAVRFVGTEGLTGLASLTGARTVVLLNDVLEHVPDDFQLFSELLAQLPAKTHIVITVPADQALWSAHDVALSHYRRYGINRLRAVWRDLPIRERLLTPFNSRLYPLAWLRRARPGREPAADGPPLQTDLTLPPAPLNRILTAVFGSERKPIVRALTRGTNAPFRRGVSLLAVLERLTGPVQVRNRPDDVPADLHAPPAS